MTYSKNECEIVHMIHRSATILKKHPLDTKADVLSFELKP